MTETTKNTPPTAFTQGYLAAHARTLSLLVDIPHVYAAEAINELNEKDADDLVRYIIGEGLTAIDSLEILTGLVQGIICDAVPWCPSLLRFFATTYTGGESTGHKLPTELEEYIDGLSELARLWQRSSHQPGPNGEASRADQVHSIMRDMLDQTRNTDLEEEVYAHYSQLGVVNSQTYLAQPESRDVMEC